MNVNDHTPFLFLHLLPPGTEGDQYNKMATDVHGVPIGEVNAKTLLAQQLGYSDKDTIGSSLDEVNDLAGQLNAALTNPKYASGDSFIIYLREVDPQHPTLPPIQELFHLLKEMLKEGKIGGTQVTHTTVEENTTKTDTKDTTKTDSTDTTETQVNTGGPPLKRTSLGNIPTTGNDRLANGDALSNYIDDGIEVMRDNLRQLSDVQVSQVKVTNSWFSSNPYLAFLMAFSEMQRILMHNKEVQGKLELASMKLSYEMAKDTAQTIRDIADKNRQIHLTQAVMAGVSLGLTAGSGLAGADMTVASTTIGHIDKMVSSSMQAAQDAPIADLEGRKEIIQAGRTVIQRLMEKQGEGFKADTDKIAQLMQTLDKIREGLHQSVAAMLRK